MRQARESDRAIGAGEQPIQVAPPAARMPGENVLRPAFAKERPASPAAAGLGLAPALDAVMRAAELIRSAQERAEAAELQSRRSAEQAAARLKAAEQEIAALRERAETAEARLGAVAERAAERLADADREMRATRDQLRLADERASLAESRAAEQSAQSEVLLKHANDRVFAAETRAIEAREDLSYVESYMREQLAE